VQKPPFQQKGGPGFPNHQMSDSVAFGNAL